MEGERAYKMEKEAQTTKKRAQDRQDGMCVVGCPDRDYTKQEKKKLRTMLVCWRSKERRQLRNTEPVER
jgi:hypothetical protein